MTTPASEATTIWRNARLATLARGAPGLGVVERGAIVARGGRIVFAGPEPDAPSTLGDARTVDCEGRWITPGLIDCHTHLVYAGSRAAEFEARLAGASYEEIARAGGGILSTVRATRAASEDELVRQSLPRLDALIAEGVTTIEIKSGYGLDLATERKMLRAARRLATERPVEVRATFLGAHALPPEYAERSRRLCLGRGRRDAAGARVGRARRCGRRLLRGHRLLARRDAPDLRARPAPRPCRSSCTPSNCRTAAAPRLRPNSGRFPPNISNTSMRTASPRWRARASRPPSLPGAFYMLRETKTPPVDLFRRHGVPMAVSTDCNPGTSPMTSLLLALNMAATLFRLTVEECLAGVTRERRARARARCRDRLARARQMGGSGDLGHRASGGARLPPRLQSAARPHLERPMTVRLSGGAASLADWRAIYAGAGVALDPASAARVEAGAAAVARIIARGEPVYGVNTGFGKLASVRIADADLVQLQRNIVLSHAAGVGEPASVAATRLMMALKLDSLAQGASGVRPATLALIEAMLERGVTPVVPAQGSVGASGDLAPLAHMAAAMIGVGEARFGADVLPASAALERAGLHPCELGPKEGLALLNGTQFSTAHALAGLFEVERVFRAALVTGALSTDAARGSDAPFDPRIVRVAPASRPARGRGDLAPR